MSAHKENSDSPATFFIPNNFVDGGTLMGGMLKSRNVFEAAVIALGLGFFWTRFSLNIKTLLVLWIVTALPLAVWALIGMNGGALSQYICDVFRYYKNPREYELRGGLTIKDAAALQENPKAYEEGGNDHGQIH